MSDYFSVFGLPRKLQVDLAALQARFYDLSRQHHPDFHQAASEAVQAATLERSALINRAYRALRDPFARLEYLIALEEGRDTREGDPVKPKTPTDLLAEMLEIQEAIEEARTGGLTADARARLDDERQALLARRAAEEAAIVERFADWDRLVDTEGDRSPLIEQFKRAFGRRAYLRTVIDDLGDALGEDQERHVSHRRH
jgi:molecular chaperone HscB